MKYIKKGLHTLLLALLFLGCRETVKDKEVYGDDEGLDGVKQKQMESMEEAKERSGIQSDSTTMENDSLKNERDSTKQSQTDAVQKNRKPF